MMINAIFVNKDRNINAKIAESISINNSYKLLATIYSGLSLQTYYIVSLLWSEHQTRGGMAQSVGRSNRTAARHILRLFHLHSRKEPYKYSNTEMYEER